MGVTGTNRGVDWDAVFAAHPDATNAALARSLGVNVATVRKARDRRGLPQRPRGGRVPKMAARVAVDWPTVLAAHGHLPNAEVARLVGVSRERVRQARERLGVPKPEGAPIDWDAVLAEHAGRSATEVARLVGADRGRVIRERKARGLHVARTPIDWEHVLAELAHLTTTEIARAVGVDPVSVTRAKRLQDERRRRST